MKRENAGYEIITAVAMDDTHECVIGKNTRAALQYVVWYCHNKNDYNVGYYTDKYIDALKDLQGRIEYVAQAHLLMK